MLMLAAFLLIAIGILALLFVYLKSEVLIKDRPKASDVLVDMLKDPLVTSRAYFT